MAIVVGEESAEVIVVGERAGVRGCTVKLPDGLSQRRAKPITGLRLAESFHHDEPDGGSETWR